MFNIFYYDVFLDICLYFIKFIKRMEFTYGVLLMLQVQWQSEQEKQESKSIYAAEDDAVVRSTSKVPAIEPCPENTIATA